MKAAIAVVVLGIIGAFLVYHFVYNKQHPDYETEAADFKLEARALYDAFKTGRDAAATKYNGKVLELTGVPGKIESTDSLVIVVFVFNQGDFGDEGVRCTMMPKYNLEAGRLQPDGEVRIKGYCTGFNDSDVILEQCSIISQ